jgi:hypothetical protein
MYPGIINRGMLLTEILIIEWLHLSGIHFKNCITDAIICNNNHISPGKSLEQPQNVKPPLTILTIHASGKGPPMLAL